MRNALCLPRRKHLRWRAHGYTLPGAYFVTTVTHHRISLLGSVTRYGIRLTRAGQVVSEMWNAIPQRFSSSTLDGFVVMPDHVHAVIMLRGAREGEKISLSEIVGWAKSRSACEINRLRLAQGQRVWQTSFHDRIIRTGFQLRCVRAYIERNPAKAVGL